MPTAVFKLFAGQASQIDGQLEGLTKQRLYASPFGEHNKTTIQLENIDV